MRKSRFLLLLLVLFIACFWWAGGSIFVEKYVPASTKPQNVTSTLSSLWDRTYRIIALKSAVNAKLNKKSYISIKDIPLTTQQAIIAVEDNRFYRHFGFDVEGILRATLVNIQTGEIQEGGSTITQQLVKNLFLTQERSISRKIEEFVLSIDMELRYSKEDILEMYLNTIYFGSGMYGIDEAAKGYFGKAPSKLTLSESAMLAGLPNAPSLTSPYVDYMAAKQRQTIVLNAMVRGGYIGPAMAEEAKTEPLKLAR
ncbi:transglycosylase domain-containing protein [Dendrosporobacter sp. 1207_IL3150]|uniref:transglycosylase domain-containing protein n=1 Tax=Dendrosporobacter sp. 1207_IL3150 TaxID=3084054 RepID=UPI002FD90187